MNRPEIKFVGVVVKPDVGEAWATAAEVSSWFKARGIKTFTEKDNHESKIETVSREVFKENADLIVVLGGDETMIPTARLTGSREVPVLGINYGSLGYLTDFRIEEMRDALTAILEGNYEIDRRVMLDVEHLRGEQILETGRILNDVVINRAVLAKIIEVEITLNDLYVNSFRADGMIVATPTGSTAYSLSAGGPIVYPSMNAVVLTPVCPFTLTNRPIVIPDAAEIKLKLKSKSEGVMLTLDGQVGYQMQPEDCVRIRKSATSFNLVQPPNRNYFDVLRNKLKWGR
ncbi:MAG: NAD(+)/NADH kinase [Pyrinomonadaceae bacterium]